MRSESSSRRSTLIAFGLLVLFLIGGVWGVTRVVDREQERETKLWEDRLGVIADSRVDAVTRWLDAQRQVAVQIADNTSLQLYLSQILYAEPGADTSPELSWLRDLLVAAADRSGYLEHTGREGIRANIEATGRRGIGLLDASGKVITATRDFPGLDAAARVAIETALAAGSSSVRDIYLNDKGQPSMAFLAPVRAVQGTDVIGLVMAVRPVADDLYPLLDQRGLAGRTHETLLLRREGEDVVYLSPQADKSEPLKRRLALHAESLAGGFAVSYPGRFGERRDYKGNPVLLNSRAVQGTPWVLMHKIDRAEALAAAEANARHLMIALLLLVGLLGGFLVAAWWYGATVRSRQAAVHLREANERILGQSLMLGAITDNSSDFLALLDADGNFRLANRALAERVGVPAEDFVGKSVAAMFGAEVAKLLESDLHDGDESAEELFETLEIGGVERRYSSYRVALGGGGGMTGYQLLVMRDVTDLLQAEERKDRLMWELVETLSGVLDKHDPYSANHSRMVAHLAEAIADLLGLDRGVRATVRIAGQLINIGKLEIPREVLTKRGDLTADEKALLAGHLGRAHEILAGIEFDGPVADAVGQSGEFLDGKGHPQGLSGDQIIMEARILAVANSFVAMTTPRAWRVGMDRNTATDQLLRDTTRYDRRVLAALFHHVSKFDDDAWAQLWN